MENKDLRYDTRYEVFTAMKIQVEGFWVDGGNKIIWNVSILPHYYTTSQTRRPGFKSYLQV